MEPWILSAEGSHLAVAGCGFGALLSLGPPLEAAIDLGEGLSSFGGSLASRHAGEQRSQERAPIPPGTLDRGATSVSALVLTPDASRNRQTRKGKPGWPASFEAR
jgi:hypothetical protein